MKISRNTASTRTEI